MNFTAGQRRHVEGWIAYVKDGGGEPKRQCWHKQPGVSLLLLILVLTYIAANTICKGRKMVKGLATGGILILRVRSSRFSVVF